MSIQFVEVNGVMIPTSEFVKNRERLMQSNTKKQEEKPVATVVEKNLNDTNDSELNKPQLEEKNNQNTSISDEKIENDSEDVEEVKQEIETLVLPPRGELMKMYKEYFGKYPAPKLKDEQVYSRIQEAKSSN